MFGRTSCLLLAFKPTVLKLSYSSNLNYNKYLKGVTGGKLFSDSFETYETFKRSVNPEFERKFNVQNSYFVGG